MASSSEASCISDPNFAVICAFLERFAKSCGITYPTFVDLQEMLENVEQVPQELIDLHIKLLRKARKTVFIEKWERALVKFCHTYSNQDGWEIERFGYKKSRLEVKLRVLKMLLEGQFDLNNKFKASINTLESDELRSKPLGKDKLGRVYWLQSDPISNIRVYREDLDEESWTLVAKDRASMVELLQELSGEEFPLDLNLLNDDSTSLDIDKPVMDTGQADGSIKQEDSCNNHSSDGDNKLLEAVALDDSFAAESETKVDESKDFDASALNGGENGDEEGEHASVKVEVEENLTETTKEEVIVGEAIEEPVMYVVGEGSGADCDTGNPDKEEKNQGECGGNLEKRQVEAEECAQNSSETDLPSSLSTEKLKPAPKLWSIDTICGVNSSADGSDGNKQDVVDVKVKHKNFSTFSIDSVLEKRDANSGVSDGSGSKFGRGNSSDSSSEKLQVARTEGPSEGSNSVLTKVTNSESEVNPPSEASDFSHSVNSKTENLTSEVASLDSNGDKKEPVCCETVPEEKAQKISENLLGSFPAGNKANDADTGLGNKVNTISADKNKETVKGTGEAHPNKEPLSEGSEKTKEAEESKEIDLKPSIEIGKENVEDRQLQSTSEVTAEVPNVPEKMECENEKSDRPHGNEAEETAGTNDTEVSVTDSVADDSKAVRESSQETATDTGPLQLAQAERNTEPTAAQVPPLPVSGENDEVKEVRTGEEVCGEKQAAAEKITEAKDLKEKTPETPSESKQDEQEGLSTGVVGDEVAVGETAIKMEEDALGECREEEKITPSATAEYVDVREEAEAAKDPLDGADRLDSVEEKVPESVGSEAGPTKETPEIKSEPDEAEEKSKESEPLVKGEGGETDESTGHSVETRDDKEDSEKAIEGSTSATIAKKEVPPQRVLSRNRATVEEGDAATEETETPNEGLKGAEKSNEEEAEETSGESEKMEEGKEEEDDEGEDEDEEREEKDGKSEGNQEEGEDAALKGPEKGVEEEPSKAKPRRGRRLSKKRRRRWKRNISKENAVEGESGKTSESKEEKEEKEDAKGKKKGRPKKEEAAGSRSGSRQTQSREMKLLGIPETEVEPELPSIRQSRRIAQLKMKEEAERRRLEALQLESFKEKQNKKASKSGKKKSKHNAESDSYEEKNDNDDEEEDSDEEKERKDRGKKRRRKKDKLKFDELNPWLSSSGSSTADEEEEEIEEEAHEDEELVFKSDHEFSPESDMEDPDYKPIKRARTAKVEESKDEAGKYDDTSCEKCGNNDHPEWILLCDKCDKGWHASCVRPALMVVPEGDWFCPPCEHSSLIAKLQESLTNYDRCQKQRENEELRRKRLAFVGISLDNVLPPAKPKAAKHGDGENHKEDEEEASNSESDSGSDSESSSSGSSSGDSSEPVYQLRERRSNVTSYRYNEYDELIKSALQEEMEAVKGAGNAGRGKDISNIVNAERQSRENEEEAAAAAAAEEWTGDASEGADGVETMEEEEGETERPKDRSRGNDEDYEVESEAEEEEEEDENVVDELPPVVPKSASKKKSKSMKITSLDFTSEEEDNNSDSDFKGTSSEEESDYSLPSESESSDDIGRKKKGEGPVRRSTRARVSRYDRDFINDEDEESEEDDDEPIRKKSRRPWESSESSDSDRSWGRRKRKRNKSAQNKAKSSANAKRKKKKQKKRGSDSDDDGGLSPRPRLKKIKYGGLEPLDEERVLTRRTRGKKINYQEMNGSDSDDEGRQAKAKPARVIESDDDFVAENEKEEMQEGESEEMESGVDEEGEDEGTERPSQGNRKKPSDKAKKKKCVIPDPDDFSENDLMEDKQLDEFAEEMEDLDEEEEEILGNILESGDVPIQELRAAVRRAKEERKLKGGDQRKNKHPADRGCPEGAAKTFPAVPAHMETPGGGGGGGGKFPKITKTKAAPSRADLPPQPGGLPHQSSAPHLGASADFAQPAGRFGLPEKHLEGQDPTGPKGKDAETGSLAGGFLLRTLQNDPKLGNLGEPIIPANHSAKDDAHVHPQAPFAPYPMDAPPVGPLNMMAMMNAMTQGGPGGNGGTPGMMPMAVSNGRAVAQFGAFQGIIPPPSGLPAYPAAIPTTVTGISGLDQQSRKKLPAKVPPGKTKRKMDDASPQAEESPEPGDPCLQQGDEFVLSKGLQDSPPKKKGRGRGKKQLLAEAQAQAQGKPELAAAAVQPPSQFPSQGLPPEGGSVISRMLNAPQTFPGTEPGQFTPGPRNAPTFRPPLSSPHFAGSPRSPAPMRLRVPVPGGTMFHTSHPLDPSPSGGGAINVPCAPGALPKAAPPSPPFRAPGGPIIPRFAPDPAARHLFPGPGSPPRPEFSFPGYYGNFPPAAASLPGGEEPPFSSAPFPEHFGEGSLAVGGPAKPFEDETGGEFGGLASYFASQREDDLDT